MPQAAATVTVRKLMGHIEQAHFQLVKTYKQAALFPVVDSRGMDPPR